MNTIQNWRATKQMERKNDGGKRYIDENMTHLYLKHAASSGTVFICTTNHQWKVLPCAVAWRFYEAKGFLLKKQSSYHPLFPPRSTPQELQLRKLLFSQLPRTSKQHQENA
jgi:hypothetical protein